MGTIDFGDKRRKHGFLSSMGRTRAVAFISIVSVILSLIVSYLVSLMLNVPLGYKGVIPAVVVPSLVAPAVTWYFLSAYFKIEKLEYQMRRFATYDSLTGLLRRQAFWEIGEKWYQQVKMERKPITVLYMDLDNFKQINDNYGHQSGDEVLAFFGKTLLESFRTKDILGRLGGEEAGAILVDVTVDDVKRIIDSVQKKLADNDILRGESIEDFGVSVGAVIDNGDADTLDTLLLRADKALYKAKKSGKNCAYLYIDDKRFRLLTEGKGSEE